jgi:flavodoxin
MQSMVIYDSRFGNTERIAQGIAERLQAGGPVRLLKAADASALDVQGVELLIVGGPTEGHGISPTLRSFLMTLSSGALWGVATTSFDTRLSWPKLLSGSAARRIAKTLQTKGARLVARPESFIVDGARESMLRASELERAGAWAAKIVADLESAKEPVS